MLYLAMTASTACAEIGTPGALIHIAALRLQKPLKVLDLSLAKYADSPSEEIIQCLARSALCAAPRRGEGWDRPEYVFTRFIADCARHAGFHAIRYGSTKDPEGTNLVLLEPGSDLSRIATLHGVTDRSSLT
jgi:hypothetical protein